MNNDKVIGNGRWLKLIERQFIDATGKPNTWELAQRPNDQRAVCIFAIVGEPTPSLVLVKQFRVPVGAHVVEFPAGLIDAGETAEVTALRELAEETGYQGDVVSSGPFTYNSPGMTDESVAYVRVNVTSQEAASPTADEQIEVFTLPLKGLLDGLRGLESGGTKVDAKLWFFAEALEFNRA
ncbi:MAG TPA: NUDIX hydrolase [Capsulimonadaceae bacterium]